MNSNYIRWRAWAWLCFRFGFMQLSRWFTNEKKQIILSFIAEPKRQTDADWEWTYLVVVWDQNIYPAGGWKYFIYAISRNFETTLWNLVVGLLPVLYRSPFITTASTMATTLNVQCVLNWWTFITNWEWSISHVLAILAKYHSLPRVLTRQKPNFPLRDIGTIRWHQKQKTDWLQQDNSGLLCISEKGGCVKEESLRGLEKGSRWTWNLEFNCGKSCVTRGSLCFYQLQTRAFTCWEA